MTIGATTRMLVKRVDELTEVLAEVWENATGVKEADDRAEVTASADEIIESVDEAMGLEEDDTDSEEEEEEFGEESDEELAEEESPHRGRWLRSHCPPYEGLVLTMVSTPLRHSASVNIATSVSVIKFPSSTTIKFCP